MSATADQLEHPRLRAAAEDLARSERRRWIALAVLCLGQLMMVLDATIVNVALPSIQRDLHFTQGNLTWVMNAYLITFGGFLLLAGQARRPGRPQEGLPRRARPVHRRLGALRRRRQPGDADRRAASSRAIGGAVASAVILAIIVTEFPERAEQAKAMGVYAFVSAGGGSIGLLAGGALTQSLDWHWIFFVNVPIGVLAFVLGSALIEENAGIGLAGGVDVAGSVLITLATMLGAFAIVKSTEYGLLSARTLGVGGAALRAARRLLRAGGAHRQPDHAAADPAPAHADGLEPRPRAARDGHVLGVLPRRAVSRARARLRRDRHRPRVHAADDRDRRAVDGALGAGGRALRPAAHARGRSRRDRRRPAAARRPGRARELLPGPVLRVPAARARRRRLVPAAADDGHGRRAARATPASPRGSSTSRCSCSARSAWRRSARSRPTTRRR